MSEEKPNEEAQPSVTLEELQHQLRKFWGGVYGPTMATNMRSISLAMTLEVAGGQLPAIDVVSAFVAQQMIATSIKILRNLKVPQDQIEAMVEKLAEPPSAIVTGHQ